MPKTPILTLDSDDMAAGMVADITKGRGFSTVFGCDIHTKPGQIRAQSRLEADDDTIFQTNTDYPLWFDVYDANGGTKELYAWSKEGRLYRRTAGAWAALRTVASADGQGLSAFQTSLYYSTRAGIGKLTGDPTVGGNYTDAFKAFTTAVGSSNYAPHCKFAGSLYVANGRYVSKLSSDQTTWSAQALVLPIGYICQAITEWNDKLVIGTRSGSATSDEKIFLWDGISEFPDQVITIPKPGVSALYNHNNQLKASIGNGMYRFTGSDFERQFRYPKVGLPRDGYGVEILPGAIAGYEERILFGLGQNRLSGVYTWGRRDEAFPNALALDFPLSSGGSSDVIIGAIASFGTINDKEVFYVGYFDVTNSLYVVDVLDITSNCLTAYVLTSVISLPSNYGTLVEGVRLEFDGQIEDNNAINKVVVKYRTDDDIDYEDDTTNFTTLGTIDRDPTGENNHDQVLSGIYERCRKIQFKFEITSDAASASDNMGITKIHLY